MTYNGIKPSSTRYGSHGPAKIKNYLAATHHYICWFRPPVRGETILAATFLGTMNIVPAAFNYELSQPRFILAPGNRDTFAIYWE